MEYSIYCFSCCFSINYNSSCRLFYNRIKLTIYIKIETLYLFFYHILNYRQGGKPLLKLYDKRIEVLMCNCNNNCNTCNNNCNCCNSFLSFLFGGFRNTCGCNSCNCCNSCGNSRNTNCGCNSCNSCGNNRSVNGCGCNSCNSCGCGCHNASNMFSVLNNVSNSCNPCSGCGCYDAYYAQQYGLCNNSCGCSAYSRSGGCGCNSCGCNS